MRKLYSAARCVYRIVEAVALLGGVVITGWLLDIKCLGVSPSEFPLHVWLFGL